MDFNGQKCPACGRSFDQDDDIVVCPVCGTPQHRSCWDERGECVNAARHAEGYVWQPETPEYNAEPHTEEQTQDRPRRYAPFAARRTSPIRSAAQTAALP